ncbi:IclR family transcriptional regulator [Arthrobacter sp. NPDC058192]|uniref:IclR family transcriptional regulator n=1 Tax=Arthrobacter sp. NPDC058192 TaxID=3346372 RepID=UPI0036E2E5AA
MNSSKARPKVPAAANVLAVLRYLGSQAGPVGASVISRDVGLPRSTTYDLLQALMDDGFVVHLPEEQKYALGVSAQELGTGYARQVPLQRIGRYPLSKLVSRTRRTAHLAVMHGRDVIYVIEERAPRQRPLVTDLGVRLPAHLTASGRAMLAWMEPAQVAALYPDRDAFTSRLEDGPQTLPELQELLARVRKAEFSWEQDEITVGFSSVAVPVLDRGQYPVASVTVTVANRAFPGRATAARAVQGEETRLDRTVRLEDMAREWVPEVARCAREISRRLGTAG